MSAKAFQVGDLIVHQVSDALVAGSRQSWFAGVDPAVWVPRVGVPGQDWEFPINFGAFLVQGDGHVTLIDTGIGSDQAGGLIDGASGRGRMMETLMQLGVAATDVDQIVQTHMHADHCGWLTEENGELTFPNATVYLHRREFEYWSTSAADGDPMCRYVRQQIAPVQNAGLLHLFEEAAYSVAPSLTCLFSPGHTPGHISVLIDGGASKALLLGDVAHHPIHLECHDWLPEIDLDPEESTRSRARMCDIAIEYDALVTAPHMPPLTLGRLRRRADGSVEYLAVATPDGWCREQGVEASTTDGPSISAGHPPSEGTAPATP